MFSLDIAGYAHHNVTYDNLHRRTGNWLDAREPHPFMRSVHDRRNRPRGYRFAAPAVKLRWI
jgi:hypothetical protein